ncbi:hypothetical protein DXT77_05005 [Pseudomonas sp. 91RF]|jgi:hypothetical protein|uniref:hypothetical protein n=1 Tax=Pseudomonas sp. 91RF TaxID=2292261 RepID=UPI000E666817|nr:hypothetical protein [Pseudomonas sp. 91RF]RIJ12355.1 hypothetical protein DXT77_05005 [Pseudomonas sp. 91RF]
MFLSGVGLSKHKNAIFRGALLLVVLVALLIVVVNKICNFPANVTNIDTSGRYILQNVPVGGILGLGGMAYLRVVDKEHPERAYRTPLYSTQSLDMRLFEDDKSVGVYWLYFNKEEKTFEIAMPQWEWHWLNLFISNTPYVHLEN